MDSAIKARYRDGYLVARFLNVFGGALKRIAYMLGALGIFFVLAMFGPSGNSSSSNPVQVTAFTIGGCILIGFAIVAYTNGVIVSAQGQMLLATLDTAVNTSPFLTDSQKAVAMGISSTYETNTYSNVPTHETVRGSVIRPYEPNTQSDAGGGNASTNPAPPAPEPNGHSIVIPTIVPDVAVTCLHCNAVNAANSRYCEGCGEQIPVPVMPL